MWTGLVVLRSSMPSLLISSQRLSKHNNLTFIMTDLLHVCHLKCSILKQISPSRSQKSTNFLQIVLTWSGRHQIFQRIAPTCAVSACASNLEAVKGRHTVGLCPEWWNAAAWPMRKILERWDLLQLQGQRVQTSLPPSVVQHPPA